MSKHHKHHATVGDNLGKLRATRAELAASYGLPETDLRISQCAVLKLNQENWEAQILLGRAVPSVELETYSNAVLTLLGPPPAPPLNIRWTEEAGFCRKCRTTVSDEEYQAYMTLQADLALRAAQEALRSRPVLSASPIAAGPAPAAAVSPPPAAPAPSNVVVPLNNRYAGQPLENVVALVNDPPRSPFDLPNYRRFDNLG